VKNYFECWTSAASAILSQALAGGTELIEAPPKPMLGGCFGFAAHLKGDTEGYFSVVLDAAILDFPLLGEGVNQRAAWSELFREVAAAAAGELLGSSGSNCRLDAFAEIDGEGQVTCAFQLRSANGAWTILVRDETSSKSTETSAQSSAKAGPDSAALSSSTGTVSPGVELLLDVELDTILRFGCREMVLSEILDLGAGDVIELDRHVSDPVDLVVGDKIVARGEAVLVNGNFGLRITEVAAPRKRLESIRCLF
jgi:flagellar motor switch protein FliN